ncbi:hypothetical protein BDZ45DRAFT_706577 [Acephala macrosclerotiorum]|nr:hypothetical protein BDZ45DRAFT_706577 [Acephala macrosclerotiorum]
MGGSTKDDNYRLPKWPESFGFGPGSYIGRIDPHGTSTSELHQTYLSHCIHWLLQNLMCTANADVHNHFWADALYNAFPVFSLNHKCRGFEAILEWQEENSVEVKEFEAIRRPGDYEAHVMTHQFKELFEWFEDHENDGSAGHHSM